MGKKAKSKGGAGQTPAEGKRKPMLAQLRSDRPKAKEATSATLASLRPISEAMGADKSPREILQLILKAAYSITRASTASLMLIDRHTAVLRVEVAEGFKDERIFETELPVGQGVTGWVAETGVPLRLGNVTKDERYIRVQKGLRSELAVPLKIRGKIIGVISVDSTRLNHFSSEDEELLLSLAAHSAKVIQTTQLHQETSRRADELGLLIEAGRVLASTLDPEQVLQKLVQMTAEFWQAPLTCVHLISEDGQSLRMVAAEGGIASPRKAEAWKLKGSVFKEIIKKGQEEATVISDLAERLTEEQLNAFMIRGHEMPGVLLAVALETKKKPLGVLCVFDRKGRHFESDERRLLSGLATSASLAIDNANNHRRVLSAEEALRGTEKANLLVELAAGLAHEIRNPLTSIKILNDSMLRSDTLSDEAQGDAQMIHKQVERLESIVSGYLESARSHAAVMKQDLIDLNVSVNETLLLLATSADEGTRMSCNLHKGKLRIRGDNTQLSQVIYNLALNALQAVSQDEMAVRKHGRVDILTGRIKEPKPAVYVEVADEGPGLAENVKEKLFQPFVTTKKQGVGLGLSIVRRIIQAHGGTLNVESPREDIGRGARFRIIFPEA